MTLALRYAVRSDVGLLREGNEDSAYAGPHLLAVADGMGGYKAGEVASAAVISTVASLDLRAMPESELIDALAAAVTSAKQTLRRIVDSDPAVGSMGTTLTAMLWAEGSAAICHIGDSRAYVLRDGDLYQITRDHTFVQALIDQGRIRPEEAATHPQRSLLIRALDGRSDADPDLSMLTAHVGDRYLLCSDGLPVAVTDDQILQALTDVADPSDAVLQLIDLAIAGGGPDNITCIVADVIDTDRGQGVPTRAPVMAGAAASADGRVHDSHTRPFTRPQIDSDGPLTALGTFPAAAPSPALTEPDQVRSAARSVSRDTVPGRTRTSGAGATARAQGRHAASAVQEDQDEDEAPTRRRLPLIPFVLGIFVVVVAAGLFAVYEYAHSQYYVGTSNGKVVIYRGLDQTLFGLSLTSVYARTGIPVSGLPDADVQSIRLNSSGSQAQARKLVTNIRTDYQSCQAAYAAVRTWQANKPAPRKEVVTGPNGKPILVNGKPKTKLVQPHYRPKPKVPADCPAQPASTGGAGS